MAATAIFHAIVPAPPWRDGNGMTGCSRAVSRVRAAVPVDRFRLTPQDDRCGICEWVCDSHGRAATGWDEDPASVIALDADRWRGRAHAARRSLLSDELRALATLAAAHPEEFRQALEAEQVITALGGRKAG